MWHSGNVVAHRVERLGGADAGDDVLALRVGEEVAVGRFSPVAGSRVNATPVPESSPLLPNTIVCTFTAVPRSSGIFSIRRYTRARSPFQLRNTASIA